MATTKAYELARLLADGFVGSSEIGSDQVLSGNLADNAVTTAKIANSAVTADKINIASSDVPYDNTVSGLSANTVKEAIDALNAISGGGNAGAQATFSREKFTATAGQTSFTVTGGYDVGYILVFMNGVLLDISDFTASDGVGFTLAVAAKAGDEIVAIKLDSFAIAELLRIFNTSASAPDDAVNVDASGNLLVGTTDAAVGVGNTNTGYSIGAAGYAAISRTGTFTQATMFLNKNTNDGTILDLRKDGAQVGSIGVKDGGIGSPRLIIGEGDTGIAFQSHVDNSITPIKTDGGNRDNVLNLGAPSHRFKYLYLSGGVYLGGVGSANKLDDYETGSPTLAVGTGYGNTPSSGWTVTDQSYVKIGDLVTIRAVISNTSTNNVQVDDRFLISSLPFVGDTGSTVQAVGTIFVYGQISSGNNAFGQVMLSTGGNEVWVYFTHEDGSVQYNDPISVNFSYHI